MQDHDLATLHEALRRKIAADYRKPQGPEPTGHCLYCDAPLPKPQRWCNADCRDDWQTQQHALSQRP